MKGRRAQAKETAVEEIGDDAGSEADLTVGPLIVDAGTVDEVVATTAVDSVDRDLGRTPPALREVLAEVMAAIRDAVPGMTEK